MYKPHKVSLTDIQKKRVGRAAMTKTTVPIQLKHTQMTGDDELMLTETQIKKLEKMRAKGRGARLTLSVAQLNAMCKHGGFLGAILPFLTSTILPALATGAATSAGSKIFKNIFGDGIRRPGGMILPGPIRRYPEGAIAKMPKLNGGWVPGYREPDFMMKPMRGGCCDCKKNNGQGLFLHGPVPSRKN